MLIQNELFLFRSILCGLACISKFLRWTEKRHLYQLKYLILLDEVGNDSIRLL